MGSAFLHRKGLVSDASHSGTSLDSCRTVL